MFQSRLAAIGLACLVSSACTVVVQQAPDQPEPARGPRSTGPEPPPRETPVRRGQGNLGIPPGHLPGPGYCRVWIEGTTPGRQARARTCEGILPLAPEGSWILYRPAARREEIRVRYLHATKYGAVIAVRVFEARSGRYLRDLALGEDDDNMRARPTISRPTTPVRRPAETSGGRRGTGGVQADTTRSRGNAGDNRGNAGENRGRVSQRDSIRNRGNAGENRGQGSGRDSIRVRGNTGENRGNAGENRGRGNTGVKADTVSQRGRSGETRDQRGRGSGGVRADTVTAGGRTGETRGGQGRGGNDERGRQADTTSNRRSGQQAGVRINRRSDEEEREREVDDRTGRRGGDEETPRGAMDQPPLEINARYFPNLGECRVWVPGRPNGRQARAGSCDGIADGAPAGAMILRRLPDQPNVIRVDYIDEARAGRVVRTSEYDANSGEFRKAVRR